VAGDTLGADYTSYGAPGGPALNHLWTIQGSWPIKAISAESHNAVASLRRVPLDLFDSSIPSRYLFVEQFADGTAFASCALRWTRFPKATRLL
jgi:hypothetical protein